MRHAVVVGGGIGGLATARALGRTGWRVTLLEQHDRLAAAGAGLVIAPNGVRALTSIGLGEPLRSISTPMGATGFRRPDGSWLTRVDVAALTAEVGVETVAVARPDLHRVLADDLGPSVTVLTGERVTELPDADLVVGADGIGSVVRDLVVPGVRLVDAGYSAWRALVPTNRAPEIGTLGETLGDGIRFGCVSLGDRGVYWYACAPGQPRGATAAEQLADLTEMFTGWHAPIADLIAATEPSELLHHPIADVETIPPMAVGRVALVGDAAHPMTPNLGQGACQALEDSVTLAAYVADADLPTALARYDADRRRRVLPILRRSRQVGAFVHLRGRTRTRLRDLALTAMPAWVGRAGARSMGDWHPPVFEAR